MTRGLLRILARGLIGVLLLAQMAGAAYACPGLAAKGPVLIAPAMNPAMWSNPATQRNVETLRRDGRQFIAPHAGEMAELNESGA